MIAVQTITTTWTKKARGGPLATLRNRVPKRFALQLLEGSSSLIWHAIRFSEDNRFQIPSAETVSESCGDNSFGCRNVEVTFTETSATLLYRYQTGAPAIQFFDSHGTPVPPEHGINIHSGRWASVEYNARYTDLYSGNWWYEHVTVNVAVGPSISDNIFLANEPVGRFAQLARLA